VPWDDRIFDILVAIEAAYVPGNEPVLVVDAQPLGIGFHGEPLMGELGRHE